MDNKSLRKSLKSQRRQLSLSQKNRSAKQAVRQLTRKHVVRKVKRIAFYVDDFGELPTSPLARWAFLQGFELYLPVVFHHRLYFRRLPYSHFLTKRMYRHHLGMLEPKNGKLLPASSMDVVFFPLVAVDSHGNRMGMGGGFYDRTFAPYTKFSNSKKTIKKPRRIGWAYDFQQVACLKTNAWDVPLHGLVSPSAFYQFKCVPHG